MPHFDNLFRITHHLFPMSQSSAVSECTWADYKIPIRFLFKRRFVDLFYWKLKATSVQMLARYLKYIETTKYARQRRMKVGPFWFHRPCAHYYISLKVVFHFIWKSNQFLTKMQRYKEMQMRILFDGGRSRAANIWTFNFSLCTS